ncbi:MFS transporter [Tumebacillus permanentifrigoris]|uniref:MFS transporter n=1 Tax=Tumebacillus permanentifrigoris TaxID=378543 RepID=A0A316DFV6_9BACL|nr:MFS transporter [Tumebacillus permanentifrigoris]PWK16536.1 MFS transporter [Tumebacillus permanentifrigoris]
MERESRLYLLMMALYTFGSTMSGLFINVFIWKLHSSFTLLAIYSMIYSLVVVLSFPLCARLARRRSPMASLRLGILCFILTYAMVLYLKEASGDFICLIGFGIGLGSSFFAIGMHMQALDSTRDAGRDRFLYLSNLLNSLAGIAAPLVSGLLIDRLEGMTGYYLVFTTTLIWYLLAVLVSMRIKGKFIAKQSQLWNVWKKPTREWRGMYWITMGSGFVEGVYQTILITMMGYAILKSELSLGGITTFAAVVSVLTSLVLSKVSRPEYRFRIYALGALLVCVSSVWLSLQMAFAALVVYTVLANVGMNLISTSFYAWTYASFEKDPEYEARRLDYVVIREIPLGVGRSIGLVVFLLLQYYVQGNVLAVSFAVFGSVFVLMIPFLRGIWREPEKTPRPVQV